MKVSKLISSLALVTMLSSSAFAAEGDAADSTRGADAANAGLGSVTTAEVVTGLVLVGIIAAVASGNGSSGTTGTTGTQ
jgi:hypothetical protein